MNSEELYDKAFGFFFENQKESIPLFREMEEHLSWCFNTREVTKVSVGDKSWNLTPAQILDLCEYVGILRQALDDEKKKMRYLRQFKDEVERRRQEKKLREFGNFLEFNRFQPDCLDD